MMRPAKPRAFTLIELLVVISIIALLIAILLPALQTARESAGAVVCMSNVSQMSKAAEMYADENDEYYMYNDWWPRNKYSKWLKYYKVGNTQKPIYWMVDPLFLEYLGFTDEQINNVGRGGNTNQQWGSQWPTDYLCPQWEDDHNIYHHRNSYGMSRGRRNLAVSVAHRPTIPNIDEVYAFMDTQGWHVLEHMADYKAGWDIYGNSSTGGGGWGNVKYRHDEAANVSFFDGHVARIHKTEMFHYVGNGSSPDVQANNRHWTLEK